MAYKYFANCNIKGTIDLLEKKDNKIKSTGADFTVLNFAVKSDGNRIMGKVFNTKKNPNLIDEMIKTFKRGDSVGVSGRLTERHFTTKDNRDGIDTTPTFFFITPVHPDEKESSTFMIEGFVGRIKELDSGDYEIFFDVLNENLDGEITLETYRTEATEDVVSEMYDQDFEEKCYVKVAGFLINKLIVDEFNQVVDSKKGLKIAKMYSCVVPDEVNEAEMALYNDVKKASKAGKKIKRKTAEEDADEDVPVKTTRKRRSTFDEDED